MKKKLYISLPISGLELGKRKEYALNVKKRMSKDYNVITPFEVNLNLSLPYSELIGKDIKALLECNVIYLCKGWEASIGCRIEKATAEIYGLEIIYE